MLNNSNRINLHAASLSAVSIRRVFVSLFTSDIQFRTKVWALNISSHVMEIRTIATNQMLC